MVGFRGHEAASGTKNDKATELSTKMNWSSDAIKDQVYQAKFVTVPDIIEGWLSEHGGLAGKDMLEFGCGEGTMALSMALRKGARRIVGVEILDVYEQCLPIAQCEIGLQSLPDNLELRKIEPGEKLEQFGQFDVIYTWSVVEHVAQDILAGVLASIKACLKPGGLFFLQIAPLYYSAFGSHLDPWIPEPWAHLSMQHNAFYQRLLAAGTTPDDVRSKWSVYVQDETDIAAERSVIWDTYVTLNKLTAPQLCRLVTEAGFEIVRDHRTRDEAVVPPHLAEIYNADTLTTHQIVLLLRRQP